MRRRDFIILIGGAAATASVRAREARAQQPAKVFRLGFLGSGLAPAEYIEAFQNGMRELGWIEGKNIVTSYRFAEGRFDRLPDLAAELVRLKVDVIVASPTPAAVAAKKATNTIPIVFVSVGDPERVGLVASLARPGGNVTGLAYSVGLEIFGKQLELLKEAIPELRRAAVLWNPENPAQALAVSEVELAGRSLGLPLQFLPVRSSEEFDRAFAAMKTEGAGAVLVIADSLFSLHRASLAQMAAKLRLPSMHGLRDAVLAGGLIHYGHDLRHQFRQAAAFVDKILRGAAPADLPVQQPTKVQLVVNLRTARAIGITLPPPFLLRADEVIE